MPDLDLSAIRARADAAMPGPWYIEYGDGSWQISDEDPEQGMSGYHAAAFNQSDAEFIAAARTDVPALLDEVERLRAELVNESAVSWVIQHEMRAFDAEARRLRAERDEARAELAATGPVMEAARAWRAGLEDDPTEWAEWVDATDLALIAATDVWVQARCERPTDRRVAVVADDGEDLGDRCMACGARIEVTPDA